MPKMKLGAILLGCLLVSEFANAHPIDLIESYVVGGVPASKGQFPWQVGITINGVNFCGGSVINEQYVLTAAHCVQNAYLFKLRFGATQRTNESESNIVEMHSTQFVIHEHYNELLHNNDIALIRLPEPLIFNEYIAPINLPAANFQLGYGEAVTVSGWGSFSDTESRLQLSEILLYTTLTTITDAECALYYGVLTINGNVVCCRGDPNVGSCDGDDGGPLIQNNIQVGIASFISDHGCTSGNPSGFTRVSEFLDWISTNTADVKTMK